MTFPEKQRRRIARRGPFSGALVTLLVLGPVLVSIWGPARPALGQVDATAHFRTQLGTERISALSLSAVEPRYSWLLGLLYGYARSPVLGEHADLVGTRNLVSDQHMVELRTVVGLPFVELGLALPYVIHQKGETWFDLAGEPQAAVRSYALGDLRVHAKGMLVNPRRYGVGLALAATLTTPTGQVDRYAGNRGVVLDSRAVLDVWVSRTVIIALNLGYTFRSRKERLEALVMGDALHFGLGFLFSFKDLGLPLHLWAELVAASQVKDLFRREETSPVEGRFGVRFWSQERFFVDVGWGVALVRGAGLPAYRVLVDLGFTFDMPGRKRPGAREPDRDGDGIPDAVDACPDEAEDDDGFEDADGCPEKEGPSLPEADRERYQRGTPTPWWQRWRWKKERERARASKPERRSPSVPASRQATASRPGPTALGPEGQPRDASEGSEARLPDLGPERRSLKYRSKRLGKTFDRIRQRVKETERVIREAKEGVKKAVPKGDNPRKTSPEKEE